MPLPAAPTRPVPQWLIAAAFLVLAVVMTWPLGNLSRAVLPDMNDGPFNVWRLAWVAHQLRADPAHLFDANIFFPEPNTLAYSDAMLLPGLLGTPLIWMGVHPILVHNLLVIGAFWLSGYAAYRLGLRLTRALWPSIICGVIFAFVPYRFGHIAHLELLWTGFMPLALIALLQVMERPSAAAGLRLAACQVLQTLCSVYYGVYLAIYLIAATCLTVWRRPPSLVVGRIKALGIAGVVAGVALLPYAAPYRAASEAVVGRTIDEVRRFSAVPTDYLRVSRDSKVYFSEPIEGFEERALFPGFAAAALALIGLTSRTRVAVTHGILLLLCIDLSLGLNGVLYPLLLEVLPFLGGLRAPARFGALMTLQVAVLAAVGAARVIAWPRASHWIGAVLALVCLTEYWAAPLGTRQWRFDRPTVYAWLADQPRGAVLEWPIPDVNALWGLETEYELMSIYHWQPLANGYSGHAPPSYLQRLQVLQDFPSPDSLELLRRTGIRWIIVHQRLTGHKEFTDLMQRCLESGALRVTNSFSDQTFQSVVLELMPPA